jgi:hypothetical protein
MAVVLVFIGIISIIGFIDYKKSKPSFTKKE